jgi:hypothetical protein
MNNSNYNPSVETYDQYKARVGYTQSPTQSPIAPVDPNISTVQNAAKAGIGFDKLSSVLPQQNQGQIRDSIAQQYGLGSYQDFAKSVFAPTTSAQKLYKDAYKSAGLDGIKSKIEDRRADLNKAVGAINDNPWLSEASRSGKYRDLQTLAQGDINQYNDLYNSGLSEVHNLVNENLSELSSNHEIRAQQLNFLNALAEEEAQAKQQAQASQYLSDYIGAQPQEAPKTVTIGDNLYAWNGTNFEQIGSGSSGFTLSDGQTRYDAQGNPIASNGGGATNPSAGIVGGYNISSYAKDPNHEKKVAAIYSKTQGITTAAQAEAYIKQVAPNSPLSGGMIINAANQYGIDPGMLIAMMQQDSSLGTTGLGAKTFNPGNVGNDDDGNTRNYGSWSAGVNAVAQWLSKAKVAGNSAFTQAAQNVQTGLTKDQRAAFMSNFQNTLNTDPAQAKNLLITTAIDALPSADLKNQAYARIDAINQLDRIQGLLNEYQAAGGNTGILSGTNEQLMEKVGKTSNPKLAQIGNTVAAAIIDYRHAVSGAAFTASEAAQYEQMFPSTKNGTALNNALISSLKETFNAKQRNAIGTRLGSPETYDQLQNAARAGQTVSVQGKAYRVAPDGDTLIPLFSQKK